MTQSKLKEIGTKLLGFPINLSFVQVIEQWEGTRLSEHISDNGQHYLKIWSDCDNILTRYIVIRVELSDIDNFLDKKISLRDLILNVKDKFIYLVDFDGKNIVSSYLLDIKELPQDFCPLEDSFYDESLSV